MSSISSRHPIELDASTRDAAREAARREGKTLRQWLDETIRSKALQKTDPLNAETGNSLEQRLAEITRRLALNTQAKLSAVKTTSIDTPQTWIEQERTNSFYDPQCLTSKQEENLHYSLRKLHRELDRTRHVPAENDQDKAKKKHKLALLLTTVNTLQDKLIETTQRSDAWKIKRFNPDPGKAKTSTASAEQHAVFKQPSSKRIAKLREEDLSPILKNLSRKLAAIESRLERIAAPEKHQISALNEAAIQLDTICDQDRLEIKTADGWKKFELKLAELAQQIRLSSNSKQHLKDNEAAQSFNILTKEISRLDEKISQSLSDKEISHSNIQAFFTEISQKIDHAFNCSETLEKQNKDNSVQADILQMISEIKSEVLQNKKCMELSENHHSALIKLISDLNEKLEIIVKDKNTTSSLENLKTQIEGLTQAIQAHQSNGGDRNILDAQFKELNNQIKMMQTDTSLTIQESFKSIQHALLELQPKQTSPAGAAYEAQLKSDRQTEADTDFTSVEKNTCSMAEDFSLKRPSSIQKEFIAAARRSADQERFVDLATPTATHQSTTKTLSLFKVLEERKKSLLLCFGLFGILIASEPVHETKNYISNLQNLAPK